MSNKTYNIFPIAFRCSIGDRILWTAMFILIILLYTMGYGFRADMLSTLLIWIIIYLLFDMKFLKVYSKILVHNDYLEYIKGGLIWKWLKPEMIYNWDRYQFIATYTTIRGKRKYSVLKVLNGNKSVKLYVSVYYTKELGKLVDAVGLVNPRLKVIDIDHWAYKKVLGIHSKIRKLFQKSI